MENFCKWLKSKLKEYNIDDELPSQKWQVWEEFDTQQPIFECVGEEGTDFLKSDYCRFLKRVGELGGKVIKGRKETTNNSISYICTVGNTRIVLGMLNINKAGLIVEFSARNKVKQFNVSVEKIRAITMNSEFCNVTNDWVRIPNLNITTVPIASALVALWTTGLGQTAMSENTNDKTIANDNLPKNSSPLNQILYGPPGTGKTYHTIEAAVKAAEPDFYNHLNIDEAKGASIEQRTELTARYKQLTEQKRIRFVTFHQSYGYEDFVEGLKARETDNGGVKYVTESGIFKEICTDATAIDTSENNDINTEGRVWKISIENTQKNAAKRYCFDNNLAAIGWGNTGNLSTGIRNDYFESQGRNNKNSLINFTHEMAEGDLVLCIDSNTSVEAIGVVTGEYQYKEEGLPTRNDFKHQIAVNWLAKDFSIDFKALNSGKQFNLPTCYPLSRLSVSEVLSHLDKHNVSILPNAQQLVSNNSDKNYVLIIDEINRGNISKIFGELITLIEPSKRGGSDEALEVTLPNSSKPFYVPSNVYIIGTMNTADRSLSTMDTALRRRFDFKEMMPKPILFNDCLVKGIHLSQLLDTMNKRITALYDREHTLGHAFLFPAYKAKQAGNEELAFYELRSAFQNKIIPLLEEYFYEDWNKISLVLGDNQKTESLLCFVLQTTVNYQALFGSQYQSDEYGQPEFSYTLANFNDIVWSDPKAYLMIYNSKKQGTNE